MSGELNQRDQWLYERAMEDLSIQSHGLVRDRLHQLMARCESPSEQRFLFGVAVIAPWMVVAEMFDLPGSRLRLQHPIGKYRADFVMEERDDDNGLKPGLVVVEVDGHEFHEKTKEQAAKDKKRDRYMVSAGYTVLHFTGSEVYRDAIECASEAWVTAIQKMIEANPDRIDPNTGGVIPRG